MNAIVMVLFWIIITVTALACLYLLIETWAILKAEMEFQRQQQAKWAARLQMPDPPDQEQADQEQANKKPPVHSVPTALRGREETTP